MAERRSIHTLEGVMTIMALVIGTVLLGVGAFGEKDVLVRSGSTMIAIAIPGFAIATQVRKGMSANVALWFILPLAFLFAGCPSKMDPNMIRRTAIADPVERITERHDTLVQDALDAGAIGQLEASVYLDESALLRHLVVGDLASPVEPGAVEPTPVDE